MSFTLVNFFNTTLSAASSSTATTFTVSSSANLPVLAAGEMLPITLNDAATRLIFEVCYVTGISGNILTVERAQEGTSAQNWNVGDFIWNGPTAGTALLQNTVDDFTTSGLITANGGITVPSGEAVTTPAIAGNPSFSAGLTVPSGETAIIDGTITIPNATANDNPLALGQLPAPQNFAPNSQWEIVTGVASGTMENIEGTGTMPSISASANTTGSNTVTFTITSTGELKIGDLISVSGSGVSSVLTISTMRITALSTNASITVQAPLGLAPSTSSASTIIPTNIGMSASSGTGGGPDGWSKTSTLIFWRENNSVNMLPGGSYYSLGINKQATTSEALYLTPNPSKYAGKTIAFGAYVYQKVQGSTGTWDISISSGGTGGTTVTSANGVAKNGFQWLEVNYDVPSDASSITCSINFNGTTGDTYYVANPVLTIGSIINGLYSKPQEVFIPVVKFSPFSFDNASITLPGTADSAGTYSFAFDAYAETNGTIAPTVKGIHIQFEGVNSNTAITGTAPRNLAWRDVLSPPIKYGPVLGQTVSDVKSYTGGFIVLGANGYAVCYGQVASDNWFNVSVDISGYLLD